ncbi:C1 family peptidase [Curtobacterium flaccumfaciens]|uniref:C1 family peptidase n=1 Tax=Curtobacterium flaccumfaciens TaxID=2035 RepID=UPI001ADB9B68|nr:C1 family peptidase [Curtobacterium flaccumfaciens]MBO9049526.1 hypothetical protein [Curtobacterium flaccumfaciens pv. flaccumfaciens]
MSGGVGVDTDTEEWAFVLSGLDGAVAFQGNRPVCMPVAVSVAHQIERGPAHVALSPEALWTAIVGAGGAYAEGTTAAEVDAALRADGQPNLTAWPFDATIEPDAHSERPVGLDFPPWLTASLDSIPMLRDGAESPTIQHLASGRPVVLIVETTDQFTFPVSGVVTVPPAGVGDDAFHAVTAVGAARTRDGRLWLRIRNSWGADWGDGGCCWLPLDYLRDYGYSAFSVVVR